MIYGDSGNTRSRRGSLVMPWVSLEVVFWGSLFNRKTKKRVNRMHAAPSMRIGRAIAMIADDVKGGEPPGDPN